MGEDGGLGDSPQEEWTMGGEHEGCGAEALKSPRGKHSALSLGHCLMESPQVTSGNFLMGFNKAVSDRENTAQTKPKSLHL